VAISSLSCEVGVLLEQPTWLDSTATDDVEWKMGKSKKKTAA
jgi:hypothetical protein